jgi:hypothetical protein
MTKKSGTYEEYEWPRVYLKPAGRLLNGILLECLMTVKIGGAFDGDGHIARPYASFPYERHTGWRLGNYGGECII